MRSRSVFRGERESFVLRELRETRERDKKTKTEINKTFESVTRLHPRCLHSFPSLSLFLYDGVGEREIGGGASQERSRPKRRENERGKREREREFFRFEEPCKNQPLHTHTKKRLSPSVPLLLLERENSHSSSHNGARVRPSLVLRFKKDERTKEAGFDEKKKIRVFPQLFLPPLLALSSSPSSSSSFPSLLSFLFFL